MTSDASQTYVWVWLPGVDTPVVAGLLRRDARGGYGFAYGRSYLARVGVRLRPRGIERAGASCLVGAAVSQPLLL